MPLRDLERIRKTARLRSTTASPDYGLHTCVSSARVLTEWDLRCPIHPRGGSTARTVHIQQLPLVDHNLAVQKSAVDGMESSVPR